MAITRYGPREQFVNLAIDSLNGGIDASTTTITLNDASAFPTDGGYVIQIDSEFVSIASRSGNVLTATARGVDGSSAATHSSAVEVRAVVTAKALERYLLCGGGSAYSQEATIEGMPYRILDQDGILLAEADFTWMNQGTATCSDSGGGLYMTMPNEANHNIRGKTIAVPTAPWNIKAKMFCLGSADYSGAAASHFGLVFHDDSAGEVTTLSARYGDRVWVAKWSDYATFNSFIDGYSGNASMAPWYFSRPIYLMIRDDGASEIQCYTSIDGNNWTYGANDNFWQIASGSLFVSGGAIESVGFYANSGSGIAGQHFTIESFIVEEE